MIIGISGHMGSGKDTIAKMLSYILFKMKPEYPSYYNFVYWANCNTAPYIVPFAKNIKLITSKLIGCNESDLYDQDFKKLQITWITGSPTVRKILQDVGIIFREKIDPDIWIKSLFKITENEDHVIIPDVRFINEADAIKKRGGLLIRINRPGKNGDGHISETSLDNYKDFDYIIENDGELDELFHKVKNIGINIHDRLSN
jgi:energy-coupling factor transporter ATP-binding protein EcfA2